MFTENEVKFFNECGIKPKKYVPAMARIPIADFIKIRKWSGENSYPITWIIKRGIKDFIKNYVETGVMPQGEIADRGCIKAKSE